jgi:hypothetical protein
MTKAVSEVLALCISFFADLLNDLGITSSHRFVNIAVSFLKENFRSTARYRPRSNESGPSFEPSFPACSNTAAIASLIPVLRTLLPICNVFRRMLL